MAVSSSEPSFMPPIQPSCLLRRNTLHWSLTVYFHNKIIFECQLGKEKPTTNMHRLDVSPTRISSLSHVTLGKMLYLHKITVY